MDITGTAIVSTTAISTATINSGFSVNILLPTVRCSSRKQVWSAGTEN